MKSIKRLANCISDELSDAQMYAEKYVEFKADENTKWSSRFKSLAEDELRHAMLIHELAVEEIEKLNKVYKPSQNMIDNWDKSHKDYVDKSAWIKQMLNM